jgi:uncharacterized membrane protein YeaQ/YmgE (transglycosylase-associated protein family)
MTIESILIICLIGAVSGWLAGLIVRGFGFGLLGNIVVGVIGSFIGGWLFSILGIWPAGGLLGTIVASVVGAVVLLLLLRVVKRA